VSARERGGEKEGRRAGGQEGGREGGREGGCAYLQARRKEVGESLQQVGVAVEKLQHF
jgi:predicted transposase YdaD